MKCCYRIIRGERNVVKMKPSRKGLRPSNVYI